MTVFQAVPEAGQGGSNPDLVVVTRLLQAAEGTPRTAACRP